MQEENNQVKIERGDLPHVLTIPEAANVLRLGRSATYELVRMGVLPCIKLGKLLRIPRDQLFDFINGQFELPTADSSKIAHLETRRTKDLDLGA